jgi:hypothetical protein
MCVSTVRGLKNSRWPIASLEWPRTGLPVGDEAGDDRRVDAALAVADAPKRGYQRATTSSCGRS